MLRVFGSRNPGEGESTSGQRKMRRLVASGATPSDAVAEAAVAGQSAQTRLDAWRDLEASKRGMTPQLFALLQEAEVTDVVINGAKAFADFGTGLTEVEVGVESEEAASTLAIHMAAAAGRRLDDASPIVDAILPGPVRLHAVLPPISQDGAAISLRTLRTNPFTLRQLVESGTMGAETAERLNRAVENQQSILVSGATGAGKTTLLASLLGLVDEAARIVVIEEVTELSVAHPHVVSLQARPENIEGEGGLGLDELVRAAMRMRPDRLVLGECRGAEVRDVLTAFNTGHGGGFVTIHANSVEDVPSRLLALGTLAGLDRLTVAALAASAFDLIVHLERDESGKRRVAGLGHFEMSGEHLKAVSDTTVTPTSHSVR